MSDLARHARLTRAARPAPVSPPSPTHPKAADPRRWQRWHERGAVAEWCHFKIITLLLHTGGPADAVAQLHRHLAKCRRPPPGLPAALLPAHWGYVLRQFSVFGELLQARLPAGEPAALLPQAEQPGTYFAAAANAGIRRRQAWAVLGETHDGIVPVTAAVAAGTYVGQFRRETGGPQLTDDEFSAHLVAAEVPADYVKGCALRGDRHRTVLCCAGEPSHPRRARRACGLRRNLELLSRAHTLLRHANSDVSGGGRVLSSILAQMANEYLCAGDCASALRLLRSVAAVYRRDGWGTLLAGTLSSLRECAGRLSMHDEHAAWSLELGSLHGDGGAPSPEHTAVLSATLAAMRARDDTEAHSGTHVTLTEARARAKAHAPTPYSSRVCPRWRAWLTPRRAAPRLA
jgi:hypothetical protein